LFVVLTSFLSFSLSIYFAFVGRCYGCSRWTFTSKASSIGRVHCCCCSRSKT
jgi:hypothetical protein